MHKFLSFLLTLSLFATMSSAQDLERLFLDPPQDARPLIIWQWMDGMVNKEGITADLEAYKAAGLGGVQQFLVGGELQTLITDPSNAIGTDNWRELMRYAVSECDRLGLTFGTHNCPGWSSSAYPSVRPEDSMQQLVWSSIKLVSSRVGDGSEMKLPQPEVDPRWNYYEDIAVVAVPDKEDVRIEDVLVLSSKAGAGRNSYNVIPSGRWKLYRFGHTTNGKTNYGTAPAGGVGLECDKMSREAVRRYWEGYPAEILNIAKDYVGSTFQRFEIDSYEAGGQEWTALMPQEFLKRKGYDVLPWLPVFAGETISGKQGMDSFMSDWKDVVTDLFAENYYGYLSQLAHEAGVQLIVEPYGTGSAKPFNPVVTDKVVANIRPDDPVAAEFWTKPESWGWPEVPDVVAAARKSGRKKVMAEGFTCWPGYAWKDDPDGLKAIGDRAFCLGINLFMLHAGAQNPWVGVKPGMTFGQWGTQWTPGQTWWKDGAPQLFDYFTHCQILLQQGEFVDDFKSRVQSLRSGSDKLQWTHRREGDTDLYFITNQSMDDFNSALEFATDGRIPEIWDPETLEISEAPAWIRSSGKTTVNAAFTAHKSFFIVFRKAASSNGPGLEMSVPEPVRTTEVKGRWTLRFPDGWGAPAEIKMDRLYPWNESEDKGVRYFSGTATYSISFKVRGFNRKARYELDLGKLSNMAKVRLNGEDVANLWRPPFKTDITGLLKKGENVLEIDVTNLWVNRLVGDEQEPADIEWSNQTGKGSGKFMKVVPEWLRNGAPRPSRGRYTVVSYNFFTKDEPLLESGLLGPVTITQY